MRSDILRGATIAIVLATAACGGQSAQTPPTAPKTPGPTVEYQARWNKLTPPPAFDEVAMIIDFAPGAWTAVHSHGGPGFVMVVTGEVTKRAHGTETVYKAGQTWNEDTGDVHQAGNATSTPARAVAVVLLPKGAAITTPVPGSPKPALLATVTRATFADPAVATQIDQIRTVFDFAPGSWTPRHMHSGPALVLVLEGEVTLRQGGVDKVYKAGESWTESVGQVHQAGNMGTVNARVVSNYLVPSGAQATTVVGS
jgi:quercetin dioxygenase-like cupin family protein